MLNILLQQCKKLYFDDLALLEVSLERIIQSSQIDFKWRKRKKKKVVLKCHIYLHQSDSVMMLMWYILLC